MNNLLLLFLTFTLTGNLIGQSFTTYPVNTTGTSPKRIISLNSEGTDLTVTSLGHFTKRSGFSAGTIKGKFLEQFDVTKGKDPVTTAIIRNLNFDKGKDYEVAKTSKDFAADQIMDYESLANTFQKIDKDKIKHLSRNISRKPVFVSELKTDGKGRPTLFTSYRSSLEQNKPLSGLKSMARNSKPKEYKEIKGDKVEVNMKGYNGLTSKKDYWEVLSSSASKKSGGILTLLNHVTKADKMSKFKEYEITFIKQNGELGFQKKLNFDIPMKYLESVSYISPDGKQHQSLFIFNQKEHKKLNPEPNRKMVKVIIIDDKGSEIANHDVTFENRFKLVTKAVMTEAGCAAIHTYNKGKDGLIVINGGKFVVHGFDHSFATNPHNLIGHISDKNGSNYVVFDDTQLLNGNLQAISKGFYIYHISEKEMKNIHHRTNKQPTQLDFEFVKTKSGEAIVLGKRYYPKAFGAKDLTQVQLYHLSDGNYEDLSLQDNFTYGYKNSRLKNKVVKHQIDGGIALLVDRFKKGRKSETVLMNVKL